MTKTVSVKLSKAQKVFAVLFPAIILETILWIVSVVWHPSVDWFLLVVGIILAFVGILVVFVIVICLCGVWNWLREA